MKISLFKNKFNICCPLCSTYTIVESLHSKYRKQSTQVKGDNTIIVIQPTSNKDLYTISSGTDLIQKCSL